MGGGVRGGGVVSTQGWVDGQVKGCRIGSKHQRECMLNYKDKLFDDRK